LLGEYFRLARFLQPIIEDVDLIWGRASFLCDRLQAVQARRCGEPVRHFEMGNAA
jgi:hypothetical protein